ncbi:MAG: GNAT family N-acetyltransferase [Pyrinomonadaceae bacterium]
MVILETERLILRMFREADLDEYAEICADADVVRYLGTGQTLSRGEAWRQMALIVGHWHLRGYGLWAVEERESGSLVGRLGFFNPEGWPGFEIGWLLKKNVWGRGYATEGARRALSYAFTEMGRDHVISVIHHENAPSIKVAKRLGEELERETEFSGNKVVIYGIGREKWIKSVSDQRT